MTTEQLKETGRREYKAAESRGYDLADSLITDFRLSLTEEQTGWFRRTVARALGQQYLDSIMRELDAEVRA